MYAIPKPADPLRIAEDIVPIAEFKAHLSEVVRGLTTRGRPLVVTHNGKPAAVVLSPAEFDRLTRRAAFIEAVGEGLDDARHGRVISDEALGKMVDERYGTAPKAKRTRR